MLSLERWRKFSKRDQIGHIASEIKRAALAENQNQTVFRQILERAFFLIDLSLADKKWKDNSLPLLVLRDELAKIYIGETNDTNKIYAIL